MSGKEENRQVGEEGEGIVQCATRVDQLNVVTMQASADAVPIIVLPEGDGSQGKKKEKADNPEHDPPPAADEEKIEGGDEVEKSGPHFGQHSVSPTDVAEIDLLQCGKTVGQDVIRVIAGNLQTLKRRFDWREPNGSATYADVLTWFAPHRRAQSWSCCDSLRWLVQQAKHHVTTHIVAVDPAVKTAWDPTAYTGIFANGVPDLSLVTKTVRGGTSMSRQVADQVLHKIRENPQITDLSGFFCCGHVFAAHLDFIEQAPIARAVWVNIPGDIWITANIHSTVEADVGACVTAIETHLDEQLLAFHWDSLTALDRQVLISIAMGGPMSVTMPAGAQNVPLTAYLDWPKCKFFAWSGKPIVVPVARTQLTGKQVRRSLSGLATLMNAHDDNAAGFMKASTIITAKTLRWVVPPEAGEEEEQAPLRVPDSVAKYLEKAATRYGTTVADLLAGTSDISKSAKARKTGATPKDGESGSSSSRNALDILLAMLNPEQPAAGQEEAPPKEYRAALCHAMLEVKQIQIQRVRGYNFLWDLMNFKRPEGSIDKMLVDDGLALGGMESDLQLRTCFVIGGLLSVSAGIVLHSINVTGRELNEYVRHSAEPIVAQLRQWFQVSNQGTVAPFYQLAIGALQQLISAKVSPAVFANAHVWCGSTENYEDIDWDHSWWQGIWPYRIPYLIEPIVLSWAYLAYCSYWGYFGPKPRVDFSHDLVIGGAEVDEYISFHRDEPKYMEYASQEAPFRFIAYAIYMINIMRQYLEAEEDWPITIRLIFVCKSGSGDLSPPREDIFQPEYFRNFPWMQAGALPSFSHELQAIIVPGLTVETLTSRNFYGIVRHPAGELEGVGVQRDGLVPGGTTPIGGLLLLKGLKGLDMTDETASTSRSSGN
nr:MAG: putative capsid protein [Hanko totivirus 5]